MMKTLLFTLTTLLILGLALTFSLPSLLSTPLGLKAATTVASRKLPGTLRVNDWELSWTGSQKLHGLYYRDKGKGLEIELPLIEIDNSLALLIVGRKDRINLNLQGEISLDDQKGDPVVLKDLSATAGFKDGRLDAQLSGTPHYRGGEGRLYAQAELWKKTLDAKVELQEFPGRLLAALVNSEELGALLGDRVNLTAQTHAEGKDGSLGVTVNASHSNWYLNAAVLNEELSLNESFRGEIQVNRELSGLVLRHINPLLITAIGSQEPIRIRIEPEDFRIPLHKLRNTHQLIQSTEVGKATVDFGKVLVENGGPLELIMSLVQSSQLSQSQQMETWFTPQYLSLKDGVLKLERMDTLIHNSFHFASWGTVDLLRDRVDMVLGIPQSTLQERFSIKNLDEDFVLQTPLRGSKGKVDFDYAGVLAQIAGLRARSSSNEGSQALGHLLQAVSGKKGRDQPAPAPTTVPLPWGDSWKRQDRKTNSSTDEQEVRPSSIPVEQILDFFKKI